MSFRCFELRANQFSQVSSRNNQYSHTEISQGLFKRALKRAGFYCGYGIITPYNNYLTIEQRIYDLLLPDIKMPEMNGFELYRELGKLMIKAKYVL